jgi:thiamine biosynthesis lipoprotein
MKKKSIRSKLWLAACLTTVMAVAGGCGRVEAVRMSETRRLMGVPWTITLYAASEAAGREAAAAAFAEVERLEGILSDYDETSELSRLSAAAPTVPPVQVSDDLWQVLDRAVAIRDATGGAFDPTVGPLTTLWRQSRRSGALPRPDKLAAARAAVGSSKLVLDPGRRAVRLEAPGMRIDLGGIGMGYAIDRALEVCRKRGITAAMIDASGDIGVSGPPPGTPGWRIEVVPLDPTATGAERQTLVLVDAAVTTSGDARQGVEIDGIRYSHVVDPRTGIGVVGPAAVTVIANDCTTADALATAASVLGPAEGLRAVEVRPGAAARFVWLEAGTLREARSSRWSAQPSQPAD